MARLKRSWRWLVLLVAVGVLLSLPAVMRSLPAHADAVAPADLAARIGGSIDQPYSGSVETTGAIGLPDVPGAETPHCPTGGHVAPAGVGGCADVVAGRSHQPHGGDRTYRDATGLTVWDSERRRITRTDGDPDTRLPRPADLLPPELARRLVGGAAPGELQPLAAARVAGRSVPGVRIVPASPASTIGHIDIWADPDTGLALRVNVVARSTGKTALSSQFLDFSATPPTAAEVTYQRGPNIRTRRPTEDLVQQVLRFSLIPLPAEIGGLPRRSESVGSVGSYGTGYDVVALLALPAGLLERAIPSTIVATDRPWGGQARVVETALVNVMGFTAGAASYVLAGPVTVAELDRLAAVLAGAPT